MANSNGKKSAAQLNQEIDAALRARQKKAAVAAGPPGIPSQAEYERRELAGASQRLSEIEHASLADRKEAAAAFFEAMRDHPDHVAESIRWLLDGNYGYGQMLLAKRVLGSPRMNRSAALTHMIAAFEWSAPGVLARAAWKKLTKGQQAALEAVVQATIRAAASEE